MRLIDRWYRMFLHRWDVEPMRMSVGNKYSGNKSSKKENQKLKHQRFTNSGVAHLRISQDMQIFCRTGSAYACKKAGVFFVVVYLSGHHQWKIGTKKRAKTEKTWSGFGLTVVPVTALICTKAGEKDSQSLSLANWNTLEFIFTSRFIN